MIEVITKEFRAKELKKNMGDLYSQIAETTNEFLEQYGLFFFENSANDHQLFFHYNEGASGIIDHNLKTVKIKGLAGVINNTKNVLESVSEGIELEEI
jgi:hypothetical protein